LTASIVGARLQDQDDQTLLIRYSLRRTPGDPRWRLLPYEPVQVSFFDGAGRPVGTPALVLAGFPDAFVRNESAAGMSDFHVRYPVGAKGFNVELGSSGLVTRRVWLGR